MLQQIAQATYRPDHMPILPQPSTTRLYIQVSSLAPTAPLTHTHTQPSLNDEQTRIHEAEGDLRFRPISQDVRRDGDPRIDLEVVLRASTTADVNSSAQKWYVMAPIPEVSLPSFSSASVHLSVCDATRIRIPTRSLRTPRVNTAAAPNLFRAGMMHTHL